MEFYRTIMTTTSLGRNFFEKLFSFRYVIMKHILLFCLSDTSIYKLNLRVFIICSFYLIFKTYKGLL